MYYVLKNLSDFQYVWDNSNFTIDQSHKQVGRSALKLLSWR
jgi:hypothetical protein